MLIRNYTATDHKECLAIFKSNMPKYFAAYEYRDFETWLNAKDENRKAYEENEAEFFFVLETENKVEACGGICISSIDSTAYMAWGMVINSNHTKGMGTALLSFRIQKIRELFPDYPIVLDTTQHAFGFFEKLGFRVVKISRDHYEKGMDRYDMLLE